MNTQTILNIKTDKKLKTDAKELASELGVPLSTVMNSFLKQFVRDREITFSANQYRMTPYLERIIEESRKEYTTGKVKRFNDVKEFLADLNK